MLAAPVHPFERLFVQQARKAVALGRLTQHLHHQHVVVNREILVLEHRRQLELRRRHLVVACLGRDAEPPELLVHLLHELQYARTDRAIVVVVQLLVLRRRRAVHGAPRLQQVGAFHVVGAVDQKILLLRAERHRHVRLRLAEERHQTLRRVRDGLHGAQKRRLGVERVARVGAEHRRNAERRAVGVALDERGRRGVPRRIAARLEGGAEAAGGAGGGVCLAADEVPSGEFDLQRRGRRGLDEAVVLLGRAARERLEPVREVRRPLRERPRLHRVGDIVRDLRIERLRVAHRGEQLRGDLLRKEPFDDLLGEHVIAIRAEGLGQTVVFRFHDRLLYHTSPYTARGLKRCSPAIVPASVL